MVSSVGVWNAVVCAADQNGDGKLGIVEFKVVFSKLSSGDMSFLQGAGARCAVRICVVLCWSI